jgi:hypothetical protein
MTQKELASVRCPVLIIQVRIIYDQPSFPLTLYGREAEKSMAHPYIYAEHLQHDLTGASDVKLIKSRGKNYHPPIVLYTFA